MNQGYGSFDTMMSNTRSFGDVARYQIEVWAPRVLAAAVILLIGWMIATAVKWALANLVNRTPLATRAHAHRGVKPGPRDPSSIGAQIGSAGYWIVILITLMLAAQPLGLAAATSPLGRMMNQFGQVIPNIIGAGLIFFVGYIIASVAKKAVEAVITASHAETLTARVGMRRPSDPTALPRTIGGILFALIIIPVSIAALEKLNIRSISDPATAMLRIILDAIPRMIAAAVIIALAYVIGRFASQLLTQSLASTGFDRTIASLGLTPGTGRPQLPDGEGADAGMARIADTPVGGMSPSRMVGGAAFVAILIFGIMEAFRQLNFVYGSQMMAEILVLLGSVVFGSVIIAASVVIARLIGSVIAMGGGQGAVLAARFVRVAIIVLGAAIGLRFMGLADDIITLAFGLILGAIAVAFALAFGLGAREPAAALVAEMLGNARTGADRPAPRSSQTISPGRPTDV